MNKMITFGALIVLVASFMLIKFYKSTSSAMYTIGIIQTASHPALDAVREGFMHELTQKLGDTVAYVVHNVQGSVAQAHAVAQQFHADQRYNAFLTIATPATQAMSAVEFTRPIILSAVTDPASLAMVHDNVCGVSDMIDVKGEIAAALALVPTARTVGLLYTAGEPNSLTLAQQMRIELEQYNIAVTDFTITSEADIAAITALACRKVDLIIAPTDNSVASAINLIASITQVNKKPLIVSDNMLVPFGALAARGIDYTEHGKHAARIAYKLLVEGKTAAELPIERASNNQLYINKATLEELGLTVPASLAPQSILI